MKKEMLINVLQPEECRIAIIEDGVLEELYVERTSHESYVGNIYKGRVVNIEPSIQAAFIDFGVGRNGFLHVSDVEPTYYRHLEEPGSESGSRRGRGRNRGREENQQIDYLDDQPEEELPSEEKAQKPITEEMPLEPELEEVIPEEPDPEMEESSEMGEDAGPEDEELDAITFSRKRRGGKPRRPNVKPSEEEPSEAASESASAGESEGQPLEADEAPVELAEKTADEEVSEERIEESQDPLEEAPPLVEEEAHPEPETLEEELPIEDPVEELEVTPSGAPEVEVLSFPKHTSRADEEGTASLDQPEPSAEPRDTDEQGLPGFENEETSTGSGPRSEEEGEAKPQVESPEPVLTAQPMEGAEHRTQESSLEDNNGIRDEDLFFPRRETGVEEVEEIEEEPELAEEEPEEAEIEEEPEEWESLPRIDRNVPVERELEEDLREAEVEGGPSSESGRSHRTGSKGDRRGQRSGRGRGGRDRDRGGRDRDRQGGRNRQGGGRGRGRDFDRGGPARRMGRDGGNGRPKPLIQDVFKRGQEVLVQVIKEGLGPKGPTLSTYISIAGRYLVLMPGLNRVGVSRKIVDEDQRRRLRDIFTELKPPKGLGFIIRTAGEDRSKKELQRDLSYLTRLWQVVVRRIRKSRSPAEIYQESDMITRTIRDTFTSDIDTIWVDEPEAFERAQEFLQIVMPRYASRIKLYEGREPIFHKYGIEDEISRIQERKIELPNGGSIVIEQTEALVAIDVNSGNYRSANNNAEETAYQMNMAAAKEIARQLRLRDLGGVIVNDFIDMREERHRRGVERALREAVKRDRARTKVLRMSAFGIVEMTRQRIRPSLKRSVYEECSSCNGTGLVKTAESMSIEVMRLLRSASHRDHIRRIEVVVTDEVAFYLQNRKRQPISQIEEWGQVQIAIQGIPGAPPEMLDFTCYDVNDNEVELSPRLPAPREGGGGRRRR